MMGLVLKVSLSFETWRHVGGSPPKHDMWGLDSFCMIPGLVVSHWDNWREWNFEHEKRALDSWRYIIIYHIYLYSNGIQPQMFMVIYVVNFCGLLHYTCKSLSTGAKGRTLQAERFTSSQSACRIIPGNKCLVGPWWVYQFPIFLGLLNTPSIHGLFMAYKWGLRKPLTSPGMIGSLSHYLQDMSGLENPPFQ